MKFYIIDDDPDIVAIMTLLLESEGHTVLSNPAAAYALHEIRKTKPDCIITDLSMAEMDGLELCDEIRKPPLSKDTVIIMVSGHSSEHWQKSARERGVSGYLTKPLNPETFASQVKAIIQEARRG